jgi:hypothetical protein
MRLKREEFFSHSKVQKLANQINKKTNLGFTYLYVKDSKLIKLLQDNIDWLDYVGITIKIRADKKTLCIKWEPKYGEL